jgi:outer membrane protein assembly factor BamB
MVYYKYILLSLFVLLCFHCKKSTEPIGDDKSHAGFQEDIPWPSLADSPWPMYRGNPQLTGRSLFPGPMLGNIEWTVESIYTEGGTSIGPDSSIYVVDLQPRESRGLVAIKPDGSIKWINKEVITNLDVHSTPLITSDNKIIIGGGLDQTLYALNLDGEILWKYDTESSIFPVGINIDKKGNIYILTGNSVTEHSLYVVSKFGSFVAKLTNPAFNWAEHVSTAFSPDGLTLYIPGDGPTVFAVDVENFSIKWSFGESILFGGPVVNSQGHIYVQSKLDNVNEGKAALYCLNADGSIRWSYVHDNPNFELPYSYFEGTIDKIGNYYFGFDSLYSVDFDGNLNWKYRLEGYLNFPLVSDNNGNLFFTIQKGTGTYIDRITSVDMHGNTNWEINIANGHWGGYSPAIGFTQDLYLPSSKSSLFYKIN